MSTNNLNGGGYCRHFHAAIRLYGPSAFDHEVLECGIATLEAANDAERKWGLSFNVNDRDRGYNIRQCGDSHSWSEESKAKARLSATGRKHSEATKRALSSIVRKHMENPARRAKATEALNAGRATVIQMCAKKYRVTDPAGEQWIVLGLSAFCAYNKLSKEAMYGVASGRRPHHRNWICERMEQQ